MSRRKRISAYLVVTIGLQYMLDEEASMVKLTRYQALLFSLLPFHFSQFDIKQINIQEVGSSNLSSAIQAKTVEAASGLKLNQGIFSTSLESTEEKLKRELPWISEVQLQRKLPSTIELRYLLTEAKAVQLSSKGLLYLTSDGRAIPVPPSHKIPLELPLVVLNQGEDSQVLLEWIETMENEFQSFQIHEISVKEHSCKLLVKMKNGQKTWLLTYGEPRVETINRLKKTIHYLFKNNILVSSIDLRHGKKVVVKVGIHP